jgi:serine/threonine protein kinase
MLSSTDLKSRGPDWTGLENASLDGVFRLRSVLGANAASATFSADVIAEPASSAVVRLYVAKDAASADEQVGLWQRAKELEHPNLIRILGAGRMPAGEDSLIYVAVEPADEGLEMALRERPLKADEAAEVLKSVVAGLDYLHSNGYIHGAVSTGQIFAVGDRIKLSTESLRRVDSGETLFPVQARYIAPESRSRNNTPAADIWCLGATLAEALTQKAPNNGDSQYGTLPEPMQTIVRRCMDRDPDDRATLAEVLDIYSGKPAKSFQPAPAPVPVSTPERPAAQHLRIETSKPVAKRDVLRSPGLPLWAYGAGIVVILLALIWLFYPKNTSHKSAQVPAPPLPAAQQKVLPPSSESSSASSGTAATVRPGRVPSQRANRADIPPGTAVPPRNGTVWRVIVYTYNRREDAEKKAESINQKHPQLRAEAIAAEGKGAPYLVTVGGAMNRDEAKTFRQTALRSGMPRDSYTVNFAH